MTTTTPKHTALVLVHGFGGGDGTWGELPRFLRDDAALAGFDVLVWCYPAGLNRLANIAPTFYSRDPSIETIGKSLRTVLDHSLHPSIQRIVLIGHSMGGLVIQSFLLEELLAGRSVHLSRVTEVAFLGTPSAGLERARWFRLLNSQVSNMATNSQFIRTLRKHWSDEMEKRLNDSGDGTVSFRLTAVAGDKDAFVPLESALGPFPEAEHQIIPGDHRSMTKPKSQEDVLVRLIKSIATRPSLTVEERSHVLGQSAESAAMIARVEAAEKMSDTAALRQLARDAISGPPLALAWRRLAQALLDSQIFDQSVEMFERYLSYERPDSRDRPFASDQPAKQQLGIALAGSGRVNDALALLLGLDHQVMSDSETMGILAGRIKRHWWANPQAMELAHRAFRLYRDAFQLAQSRGDHHQILYNGINAATMSFALDRDLAERTPWLNAVESACEAVTPPGQEPDYWTSATMGEALLLRLEDDRAGEQYRHAHSLAPPLRHWNSTAVQALDILQRRTLKASPLPPSAAKLQRWLVASTDLSQGDC